jgi:lactoylglutathione lyase
MTLRAFPVLYAKDVEAVAAFYARLGLRSTSACPRPTARPATWGLKRDGAELSVTTEDSPRMLAGVEPGPGPRHELFIYVADVDRTVRDLREAGGDVLREPADMPWGERLAFVRDPEGNVVSLAAAG